MHNFWVYFSFLLLFSLHPKESTDSVNEESSDFITAILPGFTPPPNANPDDNDEIQTG
jgi:hypothetical protein